MSKNRISPALGLALLVPMLAAWAQEPETSAFKPAPAPPTAKTDEAPLVEPPPTEAETTLDEAIEKVAGLKTVAADLEQTVNMLGESFTLKGTYLQGPDYRMRLELSLQGLGDSTGAMIQACDGKVLWDYQQILDARSYHRLDLAKILERLDGSGFEPELREQVIEGVGFSGPEALLAGLRKTVHFYNREEATLGDRPVWILRGQWKDLAALSGEGQPVLPAAAALPAYVPSVAKLWIGRDDGWPYQLHLEGRIPAIIQDNRPKDLQGHPIGVNGAGSSVPPSRIMLTYSNVRLDPELPDDRFRLAVPTDAQVLDDTEQFLLGLEQAAAMRTQATGAEGPPDLPQSIVLPKADPEPPPVPGGAEPPK